MASKLFRALFLAGSFSAASLGLVAGVNYTLNHDQVTVLHNKVIQYRKMDGIDAYTRITIGDPVHGSDYFKVERRTLQGSRTYISIGGSSLVDIIMVEPGILGTGVRLEYRRSSDGKVKKEIFDKAEAELQEQWRRFKPLIGSNYLPKRLSR